MSELQKQGAIACASSKEVAEKVGIVFLIVPDTPDVDAALFGKNGIAEGIKAGSIVVDMSSISPIATKEFAKKLKAMGVEMLDAPVSGGQVGAQNASLSIMVGGPAEIFEKIKPYFELMGKNIVLVGGNGDGQTCKVANQIVVALTIEAVGEALLFASKAGADPAKVRSALMGGFAHSRILELHGERMIKRTFEPGFRDPPAPEGSEPGAGIGAQDGLEPPQHGDGPGVVQFHGGRRGKRSGSLGSGPGSGKAGEPHGGLILTRILTRPQTKHREKS